MRGLSLFSGGLDGLGIAFEAVGGQIAAQVEIDPYCRAVLAKHWPEVPRVEDIRAVRGDEFGHIDAVFGGPPCQPASGAGKRRGSADDRWLWPEFLRVVGTARPRWVVAENPVGIFSVESGWAFKEILDTLAKMGYRVGWATYGAADVGAPHQRARVFIVAHAPGGSRPQQSRGHDGAEVVYAVPGSTRRVEPGTTPAGVSGRRGVASGSQSDIRGGAVALSEGRRWGEGRSTPAGQQGGPDAAECSAVVADAKRQQSGQRNIPDVLGGRTDPAQLVGLGGRGVGLANAYGTGQCELRRQEPAGTEHAPPERGSEPNGRQVESRLGLSSHGGSRRLVPWRAFPGWPARPGESQHSYEPARLVEGTVTDRTKRLKALGNGVVWVQALPVFIAIVQADEAAS